MSSSYKISKVNFLAILFILIPLIVLSYKIFNQNFPELDSQVFNTLESQRHTLLDLLFVGIYKISGTYLTGSIVLVTLITLIRKRYYTEAKALAFATLGILLIVDEILKPFFNRPRPPKPRLVTDLSPDSFPSGHAAGNVVLYFYLAFVLAAQYPQLTKYTYAIATVLTLSIGLSSIYTKAHWTTDIIGGYCFGYLWLLVSLNVLKFLERKAKKPVRNP